MGYLSAPKQEHAYEGVNVEIGEVGTKFHYTGQSGEIFNILGSKLILTKEKGRLLLTTEIHDNTGALIATVNDNYWSVSQSQAVSWEKNYTDNALEVKDRRGRIVLQIVFFSDRLQMQGEWWDEYGKGVRIVQASNKHVNFLRFTSAYHPDEPHIEPIFKYPSDKHFGERIGESNNIFKEIFIFRVLENI